MLISYPVYYQGEIVMSKAGTSYAVLENPSLFEDCIASIMGLTKDGLLVWRKSQNNPNRFMSYPSSKIKTTEDFELRVGRRLAGATIGYPVEANNDNRYLWFRLTDGTGEQHYVEYPDAPTNELKTLVQELYATAKSECGKGAVTSLPLHG